MSAYSRAEGRGFVSVVTLCPPTPILCRRSYLVSGKNESPGPGRVGCPTQPHGPPPHNLVCLGQVYRELADMSTDLF